MSDHGGAWVGDQWWQGDQPPQQQQQQGFQFLNQGHQQQVQHQLAAMGQQQAAVEQQQYSVYKMANSYQQQHQNPSVSSPSAVDASSVAAAVATSGGGTVYEYGQNGAQHQHQQQQWWYHSAINENLNGFASLQQMQTTIPVSQAQSNHEAQVRHEADIRQQQHEAQARFQAHLQQQHQNPLNLQQLSSVDHQHALQQIPAQQVKGRMPRGKGGDARPRGRMTAYAYFVQTCREEHKKKHPDETVVFSEFSKKCAERWKTMLDKEKKRFHEMAEKDKKRYDSEMQNYTPPKGEKVRGKKRKQVKDPNAPKRSLSAFFWFCNDERGKVKGENPEYGVGDIAKELGRRWADASPATKSKYEAMAEKDKARYEKEMTAYKKRNTPGLQAPPVPEPEDDEDDEDGDEDDDE